MQFGSIPLPSPSGTASLLVQDGSAAATATGVTPGASFGAVMEALAQVSAPPVEGQPVSPPGADGLSLTAMPLAETQTPASPQAQIDPAAVLPLIAQLQAALVAPPPQTAFAFNAGDLGPGSASATDAAAASGGSWRGRARL
jgi:hypothetical protein